MQEQELIYILFVDERQPSVKFLDIETPKSDDAEGIYHCIVKALDHLVGIDVDGDSMNMGSRKGVATRLKESASWLLTVHCFNPRLELAVEEAFRE